jgi:hypothetical protein
VENQEDKMRRKAQRLALILLEQNCHLKQFDVALPEREERELVAQAMRENGCTVEADGKETLHVTCAS